MAIDPNQAKANRQSTSAPKRTDNGGSEHPIDDASGALARVTASTIRTQVGQFNALLEKIAEQQELVAEHCSEQLAEVLNGGRLWETVCAKTMEKLPTRASEEVEDEDLTPFDLQAIDLPKRSTAVERYLKSARLPSSQRSIAAACASEQPASLPEQKGPQLPQI